MCRERPLYVGFAKKWGTVKVNCVAVPGASVWDVLTSRRILVVVWADSVEMMELASAPVIVSSSGYNSLYDGLYMSPDAAAVEEKVNHIKATSLLSESVYGADGAFGNQKLTAWLAQKSWRLKSKELRCNVYCGNHSTHLIEVAETALVGSSVIDKLFALVSLVRMGGDFSRLRAAVAQVVEGTCWRLQCCFCCKG